MGGDASWRWVDGEYRHDVPGGYTAYRPDSGELEIVVRLESAVEALGTARSQVSGEVADTVETTASSTYYTDGWAGKTESAARREAQRKAEERADQLARERAERLTAEAKARALHEAGGDDLQAAAERDAEATFTLRAAAEQERLQQQAADQLQAIKQETLRAVFQLVATGYATALSAYAAANGAEDFVLEETDGEINIQFQMVG
jgi:hypothetical protein